MTTCSRCGAEFDPGDLFCGKCGTKLLSQTGGMGSTQKELKLDDIQMSLGIVYFKKKEYQKAIASFKKVLELKPQNVNAQRFLEQVQRLVNQPVSETKLGGE